MITAFCRRLAVNIGQHQTGEGRNPFIRLGNLVSRQLPSAMIRRHNPVFERQLKRLQWPPARMDSRFIPISKMTLLKRYTYTGCCIPIVLVFPFLGAIGEPFWISLVQPIVFISVGFSLLANIYYMSAAINSIVPQISSGQWEPLRLTSLTESDILLAYYAAVQIRVWRITVIDVAARIFVGLMFVLFIGYNLWRITSELNGFTITGIGAFLSVSVLVSGYIFEPLWRMRVVTLMGMIAAAWIRDYGIAVILSFAAILVLVLLEGGIIIGISWVAILLIIPAILRDYGYGNFVFGLFILAFFSITLVVGLFFFFKAAQAVVFSQLKRVAFRS